MTEPGANSAPPSPRRLRRPLQIGEYLYTAQAQDPDADRLVYSLAAAGPVLMNIDAETGEISWTPTEEDLRRRRRRPGERARRHGPARAEVIASSPSPPVITQAITGPGAYSSRFGRMTRMKMTSCRSA